MFERVRDDMVANQKIIEKNRKILSNLSSQIADVDMDYKMFVDLSKNRDKDYKKYEHYRVKLNKLKEKAANAQ